MKKLFVGYKPQWRRGRADYWICCFAHDFASFCNSLNLDIELVISNRFEGQKTWFVLEHEDGEFWSIDPDDYSNVKHVKPTRRLAKLQRCGGILKSQYNSTLRYPPKVRPWTYLPLLPRKIVEIIPQGRWERQRTQRKMFWKGVGKFGRRHVLADLKPRGVLGSGKRVDFKQYCSEMRQHRVCLSLRGQGDINHRDIEAFGLGVPVLRKPFKNLTHNPLRPNEHYVAVDGCFVERFEQVAEDLEFLEHISNNARTWYDQNVANASYLTGKIIGLW